VSPVWKYAIGAVLVAAALLYRAVIGRRAAALSASEGYREEYVQLPGLAV
jgi:hypothetical protein